ncbi:hypothetical protein IFM89_010393 [Coptis chinensis]|uniref:Uncharacterized protein n=1 Tax=Coptis chinensis TaxID=261450 RepID=A0A835MCA3_9MAGN|nr:hypothetical protein IFM89_010393 [Coptis chinensis]
MAAAAYSVCSGGISAFVQTQQQHHLLLFPHHDNTQYNSIFFRAQRRVKVCQLKASFWDSIREGFLKNNTTQVIEPPSSPPEEEELLPQEIVLSKKAQPDGTIEHILFASGGDVDAYGLQALSDKVGWPLMPPSKVAVALKNTYMVATLHSIREDLQTKSQGLGKALVEQMIRALLRKDIGNITLFADSQGKFKFRLAARSYTFEDGVLVFQLEVTRVLDLGFPAANTDSAWELFHLALKLELRYPFRLLVSLGRPMVSYFRVRSSWARSQRQRSEARTSGANGENA